MLLLAAELTPGLLREPAPFVLQQLLGDYALNYELNIYCDKPADMFRLYTELHRSVLCVQRIQCADYDPLIHCRSGATQGRTKEHWFETLAQAATDQKCRKVE
jgi:hypothetical protein